MCNYVHFTDKETVTQRAGVSAKDRARVAWQDGDPCAPHSHFAWLSSISVSWPTSAMGGASLPGGQSLWWSWRPILHFIGGPLQQESRLMPVVGSCLPKQPRGTWQLSGRDYKEQIHPLCLLEQTAQRAASGALGRPGTVRIKGMELTCPELGRVLAVGSLPRPGPGADRVSGGASSRHMGSS